MLSRRAKVGRKSRVPRQKNVLENLEKNVIKRKNLSEENSRVKMSSGGGKVLNVNTLGDHVKISPDPRAMQAPEQLVLTDGYWARPLKKHPVQEFNSTKAPQFIQYKIISPSGGIDTMRSWFQWQNRTMITDANGKLTKLATPIEVQEGSVTVHKGDLVKIHFINLLRIETFSVYHPRFRLQQCSVM